MTRTEVIQTLIDKVKAKKYLEIGMGDGKNFNTINCEYKVCVDPTPYVPVTLTMTSDEFFKTNTESFDIVFIDGLHSAEQVYNDIVNSLNILNSGGYIICHDMNPHSEMIQHYPQIQDGEWTGNCWRAWVKLKTERKDLTMRVVDTDYGCGVINFGSQNLIKVKEKLTWNYFDKNRTDLLGLISIDTFKNK